MIWALLAWYFFGGGGAASGAIITSSGVDALSEQVEVVVEDDTRRQQASLVLRELRKEVKAFERSVEKSGSRLDKLYEDHTDNRQEALNILGELNSEWKVAQDRALDARFALRDNVTQDEWSELFGTDE